MSTNTRAQSARTLLWLSAALILIGLVVMSPAAMLLCMVLAALAALGAVPLGSRRSRFVGLGLAALSLALAATAYPEFEKEQQRYRANAEKGGG